MPLVVKKLEGATVKRGSPGGYCPLVRCAHCEELVSRAADGIALWGPEENETYLGVEFVHDGCREGYEADRDQDLADHDLREFLASLVHNLEAGPAGSGAG